MILEGKLSYFRFLIFIFVVPSKIHFVKCEELDRSRNQTNKPSSDKLIIQLQSILIKHQKEVDVSLNETMQRLTIIEETVAEVEKSVRNHKYLMENQAIRTRNIGKRIHGDLLNESNTMRAFLHSTLEKVTLQTKEIKYIKNLLSKIQVLLERTDQQSEDNVKSTTFQPLHDEKLDDLLEEREKYETNTYKTQHKYTKTGKNKPWLENHVNEEEGGRRIEEVCNDKTGNEKLQTCFVVVLELPLSQSTLVSMFVVVSCIFCCFCCCFCGRKGRLNSYLPDPLSLKAQLQDTRLKMRTKQTTFKNETHLNLEDSLCIVSFDEQSSREHHLPMTKQITESSELTTKLQIKRVTLRKEHSDNMKDIIPPSKVFLVYVDYNEGNKILECDNLGMRRRVVQYLLGTGAIIFLVYCKEKSSEHLGDEMYAQKLSTIKNDPLLKIFSAKKRIFSIYIKYSQQQLGVICQQINHFSKDM